MPRDRIANPTLERRISVSFSEEVHEAISFLAQKKKVSTAWVIRDAVEEYLSKYEPRKSKQ